MAVVQNSWTGDFLLYQREQHAPDMPSTIPPTDPLAGYGFDGAGAMLSPHQYDELARSSTFDSAAPVAAFYDMPSSFLFDDGKSFPTDAATAVPLQRAGAVSRYTPSDSPATSLSHTLDHSNSTYSHPSNPSGQSSAMGSPYPAASGAHAAAAAAVADASWMGLEYSPAAYAGVSAAEVDATFGATFVGESTRPASSPSSAHSSSPVPSLVRRASLFKTPVSPASASSPHLARHPRSPFPVSGERRASPLVPHVTPPVSPPAATGYPSPFFTQTSGRFVAPLESSYPTLISSYDGSMMNAPGVPALFPTPPSPVPSNASSQESHSHAHRIGPSRHHSPAVPYGPYDRRMYSEPRWATQYDSPGSPFVDRDAKGRCHECGRTFRDLKAHQLTHQSERPEKCPIPTCEYHTKGFARKYDRCRHTLTHYKGTMVCDFCPGGGSAAEKSFNRADVFKRHLTTVHGVEQNPPNSRRRTSAQSPNKKAKETTAGKCSTCNAIFNNAQDLYDHLDDCVLRSLEQAEPSEAINAQHLNGVAQDADVQATLERHLLPTDPSADAEEAEDDEEEESASDDESPAGGRSGPGRGNLARPGEQGS